MAERTGLGDVCPRVLTDAEVDKLYADTAAGFDELIRAYGSHLPEEAEEIYNALHSLREARRERDAGRVALKLVAVGAHKSTVGHRGLFGECPRDPCVYYRRALGESA